MIRNSILALQTGGIDSSRKAVVNHVPKADGKSFNENEELKHFSSMSYASKWLIVNQQA